MEMKRQLGILHQLVDHFGLIMSCYVSVSNSNSKFPLFTLFKLIHLLLNLFTMSVSRNLLLCLPPPTGQKPWQAERPLILVGHHIVHLVLKVGEHGEPDPGPLVPLFMQGAGVGQGVVVQEEPGGDAECDHHIDGVVLMSSQDKESPKEVEYPGGRVQE